MKYIDEYRDSKVAQGLVQKLARQVTRPWVLMEICGGQTHTIIRHGIDQLLPDTVELIHGPGCPVCVLPMGPLPALGCSIGRRRCLRNDIDRRRVNGRLGTWRRASRWRDARGRQRDRICRRGVGEAGEPLGSASRRSGEQS